MSLFEHRAKIFRRALTMAVTGAAVALLATSCSDPFESSPLLTGNTFDRYNSMAVPYPDSENVNISYEFGFTDTVVITVPGEFTGEAWLFSENSAAIPERFVTLQLVEPVTDATLEVGRELSVGKGVFTVKDYCVTRSATKSPLVVKPYISALLENGFALSDALYVRRFVSKRVGLDGKRLDVVFVEDIVRKGYDCSMLGDMSETEGEIGDFIELLRSRGDRSFEVVG